MASLERNPVWRLTRSDYVIDGPVFTTGGASPTFDLMLHLVRTRLGMAVALDVASVFIYDQARAATDAQPLVSLGRIEGFDPRLAQAIRLMEDRIDRPLTTSAIARRVGMSARSLEKLFATAIDETPGAYYLRLRLNAARRLVLDTREPMSDIAARTGPGQFHRQFGDPRLQRLHLVGQLDDALDTGQVDALVLGQALNLPKQLDIAFGIAPSAAHGALRADQTEPVVGAQSLGVHPGQFGRYRDQERSRFRRIAGVSGGVHGRLPAQPARGSNPLAFSAAA